MSVAQHRTDASVLAEIPVPYQMAGHSSRNAMRFAYWRPSVTGLDLSIPFCVVPLAGVLLLYGVGARPPPDGV